MTDTALQAQGRALGGLHAKRQIVMDRAFQSATAFFAFLVLVILGGVFVSLVMGALPALSTFGFSFAYMQVWNPVTEKFGALAPIYGTLITALIAMVVGIPISFGIAVFLTELAPPWLSGPSAPASNCWPASPASSTASGAFSSSRRSSSRRFSRS